jgi:hypothetical protein
MQNRYESPFSIPFPALGGAMLAVVSVFGPCTAPGLAQPRLEELQRRILAMARSMSPEDYAFTRASTSDSVSGGKTERRVTVERFDPGKPAEERWTLVSVNGAPPAEGDLQRYRSGTAKRRVPGYSRLAGYFGTPATVSTNPNGRTVFLFAALPKGTVVVMDSDVSNDASANASVTDSGGVPFVEEVRITVKPTRIKLVAKLEKYEAIGRYQLGPEGKPLLAEQVSDVAGSGLGQEGRVHTVSTYSDYRAVRNSR